MPQPRIVRTSTFRHTIAITGAVVSCVLVLFAILTLSTTRFMTRQIDRTVANEISEIQADAADPTQGGLTHVVAALSARSPGLFYLLQDEQGHVLAGNMEAIHPVAGLRNLANAHRKRPVSSWEGLRGRGVLLPGGQYLFVGGSRLEIGEMRAAMARAFALALGATVVFAFGGAILTSALLLRRIGVISDTSRNIMSGRLDQRIPLTGSRDELDHLAGNLNAMLDRIQYLMRSVQQVSTDIAHDLRTPLTRLRHRLERAAVGRDTEIMRQAVLTAIDDTDAILVTFAALLHIAQIESQTDAFPAVTMDLGALLVELVELYQPVVEKNGQNLVASIDADISVKAHRPLLMQAYVNLIENSIRHCATGATITVTLRATQAGLVSSVADDGPGIPAGDRQKVLEPFVRLDASRTLPGNGLGLSLVQAIAVRHQADLVLSDNEPGLCCAIIFRSDAA